MAVPTPMCLEFRHIMSADFTEWSLGLGVVAYAALAIGVRSTAAGSGPQLRLRVAALFMVVWALAAGVAARNGPDDPALAMLLSLGVVGIWNWQLAPSARNLGSPRWLVLCLNAGGLLLVAMALGWMLAAARTQSIPPPTQSVLALPGLLLAVLGLFTIEQIYRNVPEGARAAMRWLALGVGGVLLGELIAFAETLVVGQAMLAPGSLRAIAYALCAAAMLYGARRMPQWAVGVSVSRQLVFYVSSFLLVGIYLVAMGLVGWLLLRYSEGWNAVASAAFTVVAAIGLGLALFSGGLFRHLRVLISTHLYKHSYDYRVEWMRFTRTMSEADSATTVPQRAIRALAQIAGSRTGVLWCRARPDAAFQCTAAWPQQIPDVAPIAPDTSLPAYLQRTAWLVDLAELASRPGMYGDLRLNPADLGAAPDALIVPLLHVEQLYGWIVLDRAPGKGELDFEDRDLLKIAGRQVAAHLAQLDADSQLAEARQFETYNRMTAFVMHDLKNVAAQLRLISQNAERHRGNPEFVEDALNTVAASAARMSRLIAQLASGRESGTMQTLDLALCAERALQRCGGHVPAPQLAIKARPTVFADMEHLASVIEHAIRNAQEATAPSGTVHVEVGLEAGRPMLAVTDTGSGMDARFVRERLFRPFDTTKGARGMGIGAFQIREYLRQLGGEVQVESEPDKGTRLTMVFADPAILTMARQAS